MKGLFLKDLLLIKNQKRTLPLLVLCGLIMSATMQPSASMFYLIVLGAMLSVGTLSYDELDHGFTYLFTLPVSRRTYVREKYLFSILFSIPCLLLGLVISLAVSIGKGVPLVFDTEFLLSSVCGALLCAAIMISCLVPVRIKYGTEKSSVVLFVLFGLLAAAILAVAKGKDFLPAGFLEAAEKVLSGASASGVAACILVFTIVILCISEQISEHIIMSKEY